MTEALRKFEVLKGVDAFSVYSKYVMATDPADAAAIAANQIHDAGWQKTGEVREFAHAEIFEDEVEEILDPDDEDVTDVSFNRRELATVLGGLRLLQQTPDEELARYSDVLSNCGEFDRLTADEIDRLCEEINE